MRKRSIRLKIHIINRSSRLRGVLLATLSGRHVRHEDNRLSTFQAPWLPLGWPPKHRLLEQTNYQVWVTCNCRLSTPERRPTSQDSPEPRRAQRREIPSAAAASSAAAPSAARRPSTTGSVGMPEARSPSVSLMSMRISRCRMQQNRYTHGAATVASAADACHCNTCDFMALVMKAGLLWRVYKKRKIRWDSCLHLGELKWVASSRGSCHSNVVTLQNITEIVWHTSLASCTSEMAEVAMQAWADSS